MAQVAVAWSMSKDGKSSRFSLKCRCFYHTPLGVSAPIVGTTSLKNLEEMISKYLCACSQPLTSSMVFTGAVNLTLSSEDIKYLEEPYKPQEVIGHS